MVGKRSRTDGHLSKEEYEESFSSPYAAREGAWRPANDSVLAQRKMVKPKVVDHRKEYMDAVRSLNQRFAVFVKSQVEGQADVRLVENAEEYLAYVQQLRSRYLREQGEVFTFGSSEGGQCAHGDRSAKDIFVSAPRVLLSLRNRQICNVACGGMHTVAVTSSGAVYTWGCDDEKALGRPGPEGSPVIVDDLSNEVITAVAAGDCHTLALTLEGRVYAWGCYKDKDNTSFFHADIPSMCKKQQAQPYLIPNLRDVREIAAGTTHCLALLADATAYSWGIGESGQLGRRVTFELKEEAEPGERPEYDLEAVYNQHLKPQPMQLVNGYSATAVKGIACGQSHSIIILALDAEVYSCGLNNYGQLGLGDAEVGVNKPELEHIQALDGLQITEVTGGNFHTMALSGPTGKVYAFGRADAGQLGIGEDAAKAAGGSFGLPQEVQFPKDRKGRTPFITSIAAGGQHSIAISDKPNEVYTWGFGGTCALGHSREKDEYVPRAINFTRLGVSEIKILKAAAGGQHSVILASVPATYMEVVTKRKRQEDDEFEAKLTARKKGRAEDGGDEGDDEDEGDDVLMED